jgi:ankyrin repeat protein
MPSQHRRSAATMWTLAAFMSLVAAEASPQAKPAPAKPRAGAAKAPSPAQKKANDALFAAVDQFIPSVQDIQAALEAGAQVDARDPEGWTPLMVASKSSSQEAVKALLAAKASPNAKSKRGATPLMMACSENRWMVIPLLVEAGADVNARDEQGASPLVHCVFKASGSAIEALLKAGAEKDAASNAKETPLFIALAEGNGPAARALYKAGAQLSPDKSSDGFPVLALAVISAEPEAARVALKLRPDPNVKSDKGHTPLMMASESGFAEIVADLLRAKADPTIKDPQGKTALDFARGNRHAEIVAMLSGQWPRPKLPGTTLSVPCEKLGGPVDVNLQLVKESIGVTITYPRPVSSVLGGYYDEPDKYGYKDTSADVNVFFDTDANPKTGAPAGDPTQEAARGSEYALDLGEIGTSVRVAVGEGKEKTVSGHVLSASFGKKGGPGPDPGQGDGFYPEAVNDGGVIKVEVPLSVMGLARGKTIRVVAEAGLCSRKEASFALK